MVLKTVGEITEKFIPHLNTAISLATYIMDTYDKAKYNRKICRVMADRVDVAMTSIKLLKRHMNDDIDLFQQTSYYNSFIKFNEILENIKNFVEEISGIKGFKQYIIANTLTNQFEEIRDHFDHAYKALQLAISIDQVISREKEDKEFKSELNEYIEHFKYIEGGLERKMSALSVMVSKIENLGNNTSKNSFLDNLKPPEIDPNCVSEVDDPEHHDSIRLRKYKNLLVACKPIIKSSIDDDTPESKKIRNTLSIWSKLDDCPNIIKFYGISNLDIGNCLIFEWAELDNLKYVYERTKLSWQIKLNIARDVFRGLGFLHAIGKF